MKNGMPTTCKDLNIIGYTLKGFYLVRNPSIATIETVFCDFKESPSTSEYKIIIFIFLINPLNSA